MRFFLIFLLAFVSSVEAAAIDRFKGFVRGTQSARGEFEQKVYDRGGKPTQESKGSFVFQRPGLFRWVYAKTVDQVIVGDGERVWIHDRDLNQVTVRKLSRALGSTPAALLAGSADVEKAFDMSEAGSKDGIEWLEAKPRELAGVFYQGEGVPCPCSNDGVMLAIGASPGQVSAKVAAEKSPPGTFAMVMIRPRTGGDGLKYTVPISPTGRSSSFSSRIFTLPTTARPTVPRWSSHCCEVDTVTPLPSEPA